MERGQINRYVEEMLSRAGEIMKVLKAEEAKGKKSKGKGRPDGAGKRKLGWMKRAEIGNLLGKNLFREGAV